LDITNLTNGKLTAFLDQYDDRSLKDTAALDCPCGVRRAKRTWVGTSLVTELGAIVSLNHRLPSDSEFQLDPAMIGLAA